MAVTDTEQERREQAEQAVGPLLARANLLRMRGQWDEAIAACTDALRHAPQSPTAHSLLGDIYEAQGRLEDAAQWFGMAVDLDPTNLHDREKLERVSAAAAAAAQAAAAAALSRAPAAAIPSAGVTPTRSATAARARERTQEWFDNIFPPGRSEGVARLILALSGLIALVLLAAAAFVVLKYSSDSDTATAMRTGGGSSAVPAAATIATAPPSGSGTPVRVVTTPTGAAAPPVPQQNSAPSAATAKPQQQQPAASSSTGVGGVGPAAVTVAAPNTDAALLAALSRSLPPGITATATRVDPRAAQVALDITISGAAAQGESVPAARERIVRAAAYAARVAALADAKVQRVSVRVSRRISPSASTATLAFVADAMANGLRASDPVTGSADELLLLFSNPWWAQELVPAASANP